MLAKNAGFKTHTSHITIHNIWHPLTLRSFRAGSWSFEKFVHSSYGVFTWRQLLRCSNLHFSIFEISSFLYGHHIETADAYSGITIALYTVTVQRDNSHRCIQLLSIIPKTKYAMINDIFTIISFFLFFTLHSSMTDH